MIIKHSNFLFNNIWYLIAIYVDIFKKGWKTFFYAQPFWGSSLSSYILLLKRLYWVLKLSNQKKTILHTSYLIPTYLKKTYLKTFIWIAVTLKCKLKVQVKKYWCVFFHSQKMLMCFLSFSKNVDVLSFSNVLLKLNHPPLLAKKIQHSNLFPVLEKITKRSLIVRKEI